MIEFDSLTDPFEQPLWVAVRQLRSVCHGRWLVFLDSVIETYLVETADRSLVIPLLLLVLSCTVWRTYFEMSYVIDARK
jgi:hypothetical protein